MTPELMQAIAASLGTMLAASAGWFARKKLGAETEKARAERDSIMVDTAMNAVTLANQQMADLIAEQSRMRQTIEGYRKAVEKATALEVNMRMELGKVKKRVQVLETYILNNGLDVPEEV